MIRRGKRRECETEARGREIEPTSQGPPRNVNNHQKLEEARDEFSPRISAGSMALLMS